MLGALCVSVGFIGLGLLMIFAKDLMWGLTEFSNQQRGIQSERTDVWDGTQTIYGVVVIIIGVILSLMLVGSNQTAQQKVTDSTATSVSKAAQVQQYGTPLATLQNVEAGTLHKISANALGLDSKGIIYGRCKNDSFFAYIYDPDYSYKVVGYFPNSSPYECKPDGVSVSQVDEVADDWYTFFSSDTANSLLTSVAKMDELRTPENLLKMFATKTPTPSPVSTLTAEATPPGEQD